MYVFLIGEEGTVLDKPLTATEREEMCLRNDGYVEGIIQISLSNLINEDTENFLDRCGNLLIGSCCLMDVTYKIVGCSGNGTVLLKVEGQDPDYNN